MHRRRISKLAAALAFALVAWGAASSAGEPRIEDLRATVEGERAVVSFRLAGAFEDDLLRRIESGLPSGFTFQIQLRRDRLRWADKQLASSYLQVVAMYNAISREYLINTKHDGALVDSRVVRDVDALRAAMTEVEGLSVFDLSELSGSRRALVRVRAELGTDTLLLIIPITRTTEWAESAKFHLPVAGPTRVRGGS